MAVVHPIHCFRSGHWVSYDHRFTFLRHESDPHPKRWFAYESDVDDDDGFPLFDAGSPSLRHAVLAVEKWVE